MSLNRRLRQRRERFALTQEWVANAMGIPRELLSYWETGARTPSAEHLKNLARIYRTTPERLLEDRLRDDTTPDAFFSDQVESDEIEGALRTWSAFLSRWAEFLRDDLGQALPGPSTPPAALAQSEFVVDRRRASALATRVREHWALGSLALPELYSLLDQHGVLLIRLELGRLGIGKQGIAGGFFNHGELGFCGIVNVSVTPARQAFTLAHGVSHAMFHYSKLGILCPVTPDIRQESFGDAFAEEFLVPGKELRRRAGVLLESANRERLEPVDGIVLANLFRVSFPFMAMRLTSESLITQETYERWQDVDGLELASRLGMTHPSFPEPWIEAGPLSRYPYSVLATVSRSIADSAVSVERAAEVLAVESTEIEDVLLAEPPEVSELERTQHEEFRQVLRARG